MDAGGSIKLRVHLNSYAVQLYTKKCYIKHCTYNVDRNTIVAVSGRNPKT